MTRAVIDNSVIIDALMPDAPFEPDAREILRLASAKAFEGFLCANSLTDIFYVLRKKHGAQNAKEMVRNLTYILDIVGIERADCLNALDKPMDDFEDALVAVCADKAAADYIVTRDGRFQKAGKAISPKAFLSIAQEE